MMKKAILTLAAGDMILAGCSSGNVDKLQAEVAALKEELAALKTQPVNCRFAPREPSFEQYG